MAPKNVRVVRPYGGDVVDMLAYIHRPMEDQIMGIRAKTESMGACYMGRFLCKQTYPSVIRKFNLEKTLCWLRNTEWESTHCRNNPLEVDLNVKIGAPETSIYDEEDNSDGEKLETIKEAEA